MYPNWRRTYKVSTFLEITNSKVFEHLIHKSFIWLLFIREMEMLYQKSTHTDGVVWAEKRKPSMKVYMSWVKDSDSPSYSAREPRNSLWSGVGQGYCYVTHEDLVQHSANWVKVINYRPRIHFPGLVYFWNTGPNALR